MLEFMSTAWTLWNGWQLIIFMFIWSFIAIVVYGIIWAIIAALVGH